MQRGNIESAGGFHRPEDLARHRLICQKPFNPAGEAGALLSQQLLACDAITLMVNNYFGVLQGVLNHIGIGILPDYLTVDFPIERVLPEIESVEVPVFLAYPEELRQSRRVTAFRDFVQEEITAYRRTLMGDATFD